ncbi:enoyl-CoA hydratase/isomerase family protein (plasmid) [Streptomyces goshikiensis]|uniref:enoyl-CoA hydratase/isomerase family protein n=1 Tax=Streptomyces goshikiensis TaxID=1942 RepID=UPI0022F3F1BB|nr:enoyl-CoA hydratase/isomerase family protein [Streptomyces goshikiensis]WBY24472.1 enoyl-CoA hydratase/isomerase family protein [Streptomyces goshikiensis]WSS03751.1 enoyl-CoA hydratase/isomerase family protein [Streptomyces goshikiensis]
MRTGYRSEISVHHDAYATLRVSLEGGIARVTLDNPPVNVLNVALMADLRHLLTALRDEDSVRVIVFDSASPEFFIAHVDMTLVDAPDAFDRFAADLPDGVNVFQALGELLRHQPQVTIVKLAGTARGGGAEFVAAADMAFAAIGRAGIGQIEALMGIVPGGGGTQYLAGRVGRNRALEAVLGAGLYDAETAERHGWVNRAVPAAELDGVVDRLARDIAALPEGVIAAAKRALAPEDLSEGLRREHDAWAGQFARPAAERLIRGALARGAQTRDGERDLEGLLRGLAG